MIDASSFTSKTGHLSAHPQLTVISAEDLYHQDIEELEAIVDNLLFKGLTILSGRPKGGKSWLALQLAMGMAAQCTFAGLRINSPGRVLYLALEEPKRRTQGRMKQLTQANDFLADIDFVYDIQPMAEGGLEQLDHYLENNPAELVIIDTYLAFLRSEGSKKDIVQADYNSMNALRKLADRHDCAIVLIHHTRKAEGDAVDSLLGTTGISAACDCIWQLQRGQQKGEAVLNVTGREVEQQSLALQFSTDPESFGWKFTGAGSSAAISPERRAILQLIASNPLLPPKEIAARLGKNENTTRRLIQGLSQAGLIEKNGEGYQLVQ